MDYGCRPVHKAEAAQDVQEDGDDMAVQAEEQIEEDMVGPCLWSCFGGGLAPPAY
jgi:hypothetical protein